MVHCAMELTKLCEGPQGVGRLFESWWADQNLCNARGYINYGAVL